MVCVKYIMYIKYVEKYVYNAEYEIIICGKICTANGANSSQEMELIFEILLIGLTGEADSIGTYTTSTIWFTCIAFKITK